ncbi:conserved hypothetical protein [Verticillium alfalfae VaMs.102]|uniref:Uncharacterized protein n=1 Tax=Verticillium alfalfae (strain VaMs.102 / ATCC MYA-4576 / FGSC 10136) TaxID=526221 RepID=C9SZ87_VERA1|nr:conserved hypothetical protein [Verticillium alfalfae VaMs.102]EEY24102.1 conserved hypothetical protein [Verticillium alfalfae VaMs.102]
MCAYANPESKGTSPTQDRFGHHGESLADTAADDSAIYPKGTLDPVYEAKARVLNRAVCYPTPFARALIHENSD